MPTQDVLLRFFTIPNLPKSEWEAAIPFEARKFIPFKMESLVWDYRVHPSPVPNQLDIVFAAIQEDTLQRLLGVLRRCGIAPTVIEPRSVGLARLAAGAGAAPGVQEFACVVDIEQGAAHLAIVKGGLPYLTRDILLSSEAEAAAPAEDPAAGLDTNGQRVLSELSVSIDFFLREYPSTHIGGVYLFGEETRLAGWLRPLSEALHVPVALGTNLLAPHLEGSIPLSFASAVGLLQAGHDKAGLDFLRRSEAKDAPASAALSGAALSKMAALESLKDLRPGHVMSAAVVVAIGLGLMWFTGTTKVGGRHRQLQQLIQARRDVGYGLSSMSAEQLKPLQNSAQGQLELLKRIIDERTSVATQLDALAKARPEGLWFTSITYEAALDPQGKAYPKLAVKGACYLNQTEQEVTAIQSFEQQVRRSAMTLGVFSTTRLGQIDAATTTRPDANYHTFQLTCQNEARF
jgi:Tfp pilus assembly PilM family ATPase